MGDFATATSGSPWRDTTTASSGTASAEVLPPIVERRRRLALEADERHALDVRAVGVAGREAEALELTDQIRHRPLFARRAGSTAQLVVGREGLHVAEHHRRGDDARRIGDLRG